MPKDYAVQCTAASGMLKSELVVKIELPEGKSVSALVHKNNVIVQSEPSPGQPPVEGKVKVSLVENRKDTVVVDLPGTGITNGTRVSIPKSLLRK